MKTGKAFEVTIELDIITFNVFAQNATEAKKKALIKLSNRNPVNMIRKSYPDNKKEISVEQVN